MLEKLEHTLQQPEEHPILHVLILLLTAASGSLLLLLPINL